MVFDINNHIQKGNAGSAAQRFFRRGVRTKLPNSIDREINHRQMIKSRHEKQVALALSKGRSSAEQFQVDDKVVVQNHKTGRWSESGTIKESRTAEDGTTHSHVVSMEDGSEVLRNKRFIKHNIWLAKKKVRFSGLADEEDSSDKALSESD